jgi:tetratricopeptide (TPR) repeat protein
MTKKFEASLSEKSAKAQKLPVSVRAYAPGYAGAVLIILFFAALLLYLGFLYLSAVAASTALLVIPFLALTDKFVFDGRRLIRTGLLPKLWFRLNGLRPSVKLRNIEQIDTAIVGTFKRGGRVRFMHRTTVFGNAPPIVFAGSGHRFREMSEALFSRVDPRVLDARSLELAKFSTTPREALRIAADLKIPASDVLEGSLRNNSLLKSAAANGLDPRLSEISQAEMLRNAANKLCASGFLVRAYEAFRRALHLQPGNPGLLFEFSRCMHLLAFVRRNKRFERRAAAALRLAERRAGGDTELLERIAETYRQFGYSRRAAAAYRTVIETIGDAFRSLVGLAELALDEGKLAHVVHNFSAANRIATTAAQRRWTNAEADYFARLSEDEEYMELEISRLNLLEKLDRWRRIALRLALYSLPLIAAGTAFDDALVADAGWLVSSTGFLTWAGMNIGIKMLSSRIPYDLVANEK